MDSASVRARAPLLLKDYLLDDMSSCSSNGFKSFPRRQCCTTVRFIHDSDRKIKQKKKKKEPEFNKSTPPTKSAIAALQSVVTAVKRLPFPAAKSPEKRKSGNNSFLPRSFSKKIFKKSGFWKKKKTTVTAEKREIGRWKSFDELLKEDPSPSDQITAAERKSESWSGIDFTAPTSGNSVSTTEVKLNLDDSRNDAVREENKEDRGNMVVGATNDDVSVDSTTCSDGSGGTKSSTNKGDQKQWGSEEKEQFSPVSVLECPFDDEDEVSSPFQHRLARMEGTKKKLMKKIQMFECLAKFEPVNLSSRFASHSSSSTDEKSTSDIEESEEEEERNETEQKALELFHRTKANLPAYNLKLKADKLLLDFFRENITNHEREVTRERRSSELLEAAQEWIDGVEPHGSLVEWGLKKNREAHVKEMEKGGVWKTLDHENNEVALELEDEVYSALLHELVLDMASAN